MNVLCYTSFTFAYLDRTRVLFASVRRHHPDWELVALITDKPPAGVDWDERAEPWDRTVWAEDLAIEPFTPWMFKHDVVEVCTAVKGPFLHQACASGADVVIYLDPDTCVFNPLTPVLDALQTHDIVLTPHQLTPETDRGAIVDNEITSLKTGIYNLGFVAIRTQREGARFAKWWSDRLLQFCHDDILNGLFVDQRWCDHVPSFFEHVKILKDPGHNVASWNLSHRTITIGTDGQIYVNGHPLRFWHFTKLGPVGDMMTKKYAKDNFQVYELWNWYKRQIAEAQFAGLPARYWHWGPVRGRRTDREISP